MPFPKPQLITPEFMIDALDNHTLDAIRAQRRGLALMLRAAGKADKLDNIAETRRCAAAILNYKPYYPPKHAFLDGAIGFQPMDEAPATTHTPEPPTPNSPSLMGARAGGRVPAAPENPEPTITPVPPTPSVLSVPSVPSPTPVIGSPSPYHRLTVSPSQSPPIPQDSIPPTPVVTQQPPPSPEPPYEPTGELWDPSIDKDAWYAKYMKREPYKPYIHRNYLYVLLMALSLIFNSSPSLALFPLLPTAPTVPLGHPDQSPGNPFPELSVSIWSFSPMADLKNLKGISEADRKLISEAEEWLGAEPTKMGPVKNLFWGNIKEDYYFPYPTQDAREVAECDQLLARLDEYLRTEHPAIAIDQEQEIPRWVVDKLFGLGVLGMTIPKEFGGLGMGITSYNRVLEKIGFYCGSTAVMVSAHQSIGCKAVMLFGNAEQKAKWLPRLAKDWLSAFCLSEPNVGCDAGGQETNFTKTEDGEFYIINGEKKWATSGAISGLFTVMCRANQPDGKGKISALVCHPEMPGVEIYQKNRSKCGIRGTWQARIRFHNVRVPKANLLGQEGRGLQMALSCLNFGRCTLSAGMLGGARRVRDQATKWATTRFQFGAALADKELVRQRIARMAAYDYAMDAVLYMTTAMLDRKDDDIQVETAVCKVFCSEYGWRVTNDGMQIMGGESYMSENEVERVFRDSRINLIVEGANEVMQSYIFGYGGKQLAEQMLGIRSALMRDKDEGFVGYLFKAAKNSLRPKVMKIAIPLGMEVFMGIRRRSPVVTRLVNAELKPFAERLASLVREQTYLFKHTSYRFQEETLKRQAVQARLADSAILLHAALCTLAKLDLDLKTHAGNGASDIEFQRDKAAAIHFFDLAEVEIKSRFRELTVNADDTMLPAADICLKHIESLAPDSFIIPEKTPTAQRGKGRTPKQDGIKQFPGTPTVPQPHGAMSNA